MENHETIWKTNGLAMKLYRLNEKGVALVTTLLLGFLAIGLVATAYFLGLRATRMSGLGKRYITELDVAKGTSQYIMATLRASSLTCNGGGACVGDQTCASAASNIDIHPNICASLGKAGCANIAACYLSSTVSGTDTMTSVNVRSNNPNTGEQAVVDFVYKLSP
ncbi:MAG: hypothetical protein ACYC0O_08860 [Desulfurivibrionaceae bacterium]|jgi:hypothetical protein|nr:hypothetical protein [Pseudomonadota bacterium]MBU4408451.1 hypothetical protein [Pseudomonadota bacterium]MBU4413447.1 hypothetical protein [Pseudomonadota bacterium]MCG2824928.1 hypothetical protein [Desulfobulbaceae bacterium]MDP2758772.1 hypothetical protein [Desulfurivibrionaceae bacterium]